MALCSAVVLLIFSVVYFSLISYITDGASFSCNNKKSETKVSGRTVSDYDDNCSQNSDCFLLGGDGYHKRFSWRSSCFVGVTNLFLFRHWTAQFSVQAMLDAVGFTSVAIFSHSMGTPGKGTATFCFYSSLLSSSFASQLSIKLAPKFPAPCLISPLVLLSTIFISSHLL